MIKKNVLTAFGIILSFGIAVGGWLATSWLIDRESYRLLSGTSSFVVDVPTIEVVYTNSEDDEPYIVLGLTENEIVSILRNWEMTENRRPHEPAAGQLNMEQAIAAGREGLDFLYNHNVLPTDMYGFNSVSAILSQNVPQGEVFLPLRYSYWEVTFRTQRISVEMTINAVTGQIWGIYIHIPRSYGVVVEPMLTVNFDEIVNIIDAFMLNLGIRVNQGPIITWGNTRSLIEHAPARQANPWNTNPWNTAIVYQSFADANAALIIDATGFIVFDDDVGKLNFNRLNIYLTV